MIRGLYDEIEQVLVDYPAMKVNLTNLSDAEDSYDFSLDHVRVSGGDPTSRVERLAVKRADYSRYVAVVDALMAIMPGLEKKYIQLRYWDGVDMKDIADLLHVGDRTVYDIRARALDRFAVALGWGRRYRQFMRPVRIQGTLYGLGQQDAI